MSKGFLKTSKGFTLLETMFGVLLMALFAVPIATSFFTTSRLNAGSKALLDATAAANRIIEQMSTTSVDPTPPEGIPLNDYEYTKYGVDHSVFTVTKKISIISKKDVSGDITDNLKNGQYMLALDTTTPGKITDYVNKSDILIYSGQNPSVDIIINNSSVNVGTTYIPGNYGYICIYTSENKLNLNVKNRSTKVMSLYIISPPEGVTSLVTVNPIADPSSWNIFDNLSSGAVYPLGEISLVDIRVNVKHNKSGLSYETDTQKPIYNFSF